MQKIPNSAALIVVDVQKGFDDPAWGWRNNLFAEQNIERLLRAWRQSKRPVFHVQHLSRDLNSPLNPNSAGSEIKEIVKPRATNRLFKSTSTAHLSEQILKSCCALKKSKP